MKVVLLGYMASGKSIIGNKLSEALNFSYQDLDDYIETNEGSTIKELFADKGEIYFRKIEQQYLKEIILKEENCVISLGGGTPCYSNNMSLLLNKENIKTIYLKVSLNELVKRLFSEKTNRPLITHIEKEEVLLEFVGKHLFERSHFYNQAEICVEADKKPKDVTETILTQLI